ncbi:sensor histidine kinase [Aliarcobacter butzleri]|uniref:sensor histidine kinase n=1 Tax=Aliarcobacter butzleri TaxID=28197 RepID=UPI00263D414D|nr:sensor histidine kinase [Aliarcobacter butzleri]MDN5104671.1 sensor histidine kinase [Aliarcobacter butzleri]
MKQDNYLKIRPEARLIQSIGEDLIKDHYAAVIELVKNSYDADSKEVNITIEFTYANLYDNKKEKFIKFTIEDFGEGMTFDTIKNNWMVPATSNKLYLKTSHEGRILQGRKGIGRYASAILGEYLKIETTDKTGITTLIDIDWKNFESTPLNKKFLDEIKIPYETEKTNLKNGTKIEIFSKIREEEKYIEDRNGNKILTIVEVVSWEEEYSKKLVQELKKLISPFLKDQKDKFDITLEIKGLEHYLINDLKKTTIEPYPILDLCDYQIIGELNSYGNGTLQYINNNYTKENETIYITSNIENYQCGNLKIDLRFFDLEPEAIEALIERSENITGEGNSGLSKSNVRDLIKANSGIGIYRGLFRIRPYGDSNYDWLELNRRRVNNPTNNFSINQVSGFIHIESDEKSNLIEKSAREGLKENKNYESLQKLIHKVISYVQDRRYKFRKNTKRGRKPSNNIHEDIINLFNFDDMSSKVTNYLNSLGVEDNIVLKIEETIKNEEKKKTNELKKVQDTLVMYEAHAALGRMVRHIVHEGRKPLMIMADSFDYLRQDIAKLEINNEALKKEINESILTNETQINYFQDIFDKIEPLTAKRLKRKKNFNLVEDLKTNISFYRGQLEKNGIKLILNYNEEIEFFGRKEDFYIVYSNLFENAIFWLKENNIENKRIEINLYKEVEEEKRIIIEFKDNGKGVPEKFINDIFDAGFSSKPEGGTGIGLVLAGQAISRNNGKLKYVKSKGACFQIELNYDKALDEKNEIRETTNESN